MTAGLFTLSMFKDHPVPATIAPAHQEKTVQKIMLAAAAAMGLLIPAGGAFAQDADSMTINTAVSAHCVALAAPSGPISLGELADGNGFLDTSILSGDESYTFPGFWCNSPVNVQLTAAPLVNTAVAGPVDPAFTTSVNFVAQMVWDDVNGTDNSAAPGATSFNTTEANTGNLTLKVQSLAADPNHKLVAGPYAGSISVTFTTL